MLAFITPVVDFFKKNPTFLLVLAAIIVMWFMAVVPLKNELKEERASRAKFEKAVLANVAALQDSVERKIDENGDIFSEKLAFVASDLEDLAQYDEDLYKRLVERQDDLKAYIDSEVKILLTEVGKYGSSVEQTSDSTFNLETFYNYADSGLTHNFRAMTPLTFSGNRLFEGNTNILQNEFFIALEYSLVEEDGRTSVVARSPSDYVFFNDLNSIYLDENLTKVDKRNTRFGVGPTVGVAFIPTHGIQPYVGIGLNYNLVVFKKFK